MANKKEYFYYVCVFAGDGPAFVTSIDYYNKYSCWNKNEKPKRFTMTMADDLVFGLRCNGFMAFTVKSPVEVDYQPYDYDHYECKFVKKEEEDGKKQS